MSWPDFWTKTTWKTTLFMPLSALVCRIAKRRWQTFQSAQSKVSTLPVCVVGNIVVGGSGKTPFILGLVQAAHARGIKVGVVSRGYGGKSKHWPMAVNAQSDPNLVGDEPVMLAKAFAQMTMDVPIAVSPKRQQAVELLSNTTDCDWLLSDDGLQHYAMPRQCEVVLVDAQRWFGNEQCLPAGPLREPLDKLNHVDAVVMNLNHQSLSILPQFQQWQTSRAIAVKHLAQMQLKPLRLVNILNPSITLPVEVLQQKTVNAIAGIGNPQRFFATLESLGAKVHGVGFADHHTFRQEDLQAFNRPVNFDCLQNPGLSENALIMTAKDAVKCRIFAEELKADNWWFLVIESEVEPQILEIIFSKMAL